MVDELWSQYGHHRSFQGWYFNREISYSKKNPESLPEMIEYNRQLGLHVKNITGDLPIMISPYIAGVKKGTLDNVTTIEEHAQVWEEILAAFEGIIDILAFQDGQCEYDELPEYLALNKEIADRHKMISWTNCESFDRDMPIRVLPIKWEKMRLKLEAAAQVGVEKAITFEFSHFMSPNSMYPSAHGLFDRYMEYISEK